MDNQNPARRVGRFALAQLAMLLALGVPAEIARRPQPRVLLDIDNKRIISNNRHARRGRVTQSIKRAEAKAKRLAAPSTCRKIAKYLAKANHGHAMYG